MTAESSQPTGASEAPRIESIEAGVLDIAYLRFGPDDGPPVVLLHGFPYDAQACVASAQRLASDGCSVIVPHLRGHGPTRFLSAETLRSGEQAALGHDLLALLDALQIERAVLAGYDWGGRAACVVAALWPQRCAGLVSASGYNIQDISTAGRPLAPDSERRLWYQYYFHSERGRAGLAANRHELCRLLWGMWSPKWQFDDATYERSAVSFDNVDYVDVVIHSYRHRFALVDGDPAYTASERRLAAQPLITVPTIAIDGDSDGVRSDASAQHARYFSGPYQRRVYRDVGHNVPQEAPDDFADAVLELVRGASDR